MIVGLQPRDRGLVHAQQAGKRGLRQGYSNQETGIAPRHLHAVLDEYFGHYNQHRRTGPGICGHRTATTSP